MKTDNLPLVFCSILKTKKTETKVSGFYLRRKRYKEFKTCSKGLDSESEEEL